MPKKNKKKKRIDNPPLLSISNYYDYNKLNNKTLSFSETIVSSPSVLRKFEGISLVYIRKGNGILSVNSQNYSVHEGYFMILGSYHFTKIIPEDDPIIVNCCAFPIETFLYILANPYYNITSISLYYDPFTSCLDKNDRYMVEKIFDTMTEKKKDALNKKALNKNFLLAMRLLGILESTGSGDFWEQVE